ncbi:hypothetical protein [Parachitinimonas caeni]|uniref:HEAT repeat domain-containing protein n=1 Tax=Parachitinimonas caeni TaxID=3031301 RepID=A0ABT7E270_9NEIS|nr:hypothetical protein [Parachitinimonas caeni]MDK2126405.1 hypothetical protein [Parachitinimonas caeni]
MEAYEYRKLGLPLRCAVEVAAQLGRIAKPLERHLREEFKKGDHRAAKALGMLGTIEQETVAALAESLLGGPDLSHESARALVCCGEAENPEVRKVVESSEKAKAILSWAASYVGRQNSHKPPIVDAQPLCQGGWL